MALLEVRELSVSFLQYENVLRRKEVPILRNLSFSLDAGEIMAVVGASGSGKSVLAHALLGILPKHAKVTGELRWRGQRMTDPVIQQLRGSKMALVPQSVAYLDPLMRVGQQVQQSVRRGDPAQEQKKAFQKYRLSPAAASYYPFQLSGGMARRVLLSMAEVSGAELLIADEPTPGLDPEAVRETLRSFQERAASGSTILLITHDLEAALSIAHNVAVFYSGMVLEIAPAADFEGSGARLRHPYSRALWRALPQHEFTVPPASRNRPSERQQGCVFAPQCDMATAECLREVPALRECREGWVRCIHAP